jgi:hypothetical protein
LIKFKVRGLEEVERFLKELPRGSMRSAIKAFSEYILGNEQHGLKHYVPYKHVTRTQAYGRPFETDKQRRWFFANLKSGALKIPYQRTGKLRDNWVLQGSEYQKNIKNKLPYAPYVMGIAGQSRMSRKIGWKSWLEVVQNNMKGGMRAATQAVAKWIKDKGK